MTLAELGLGTPDGRSAAAGSLYFVAPATPGGPRMVYRLNAATLILDLKRRMGSPEATSTAYGPQTHTGARELAIRHGATAGEVPPAASTYRAGASLSAGVLRVLAWLAYVQPFGVPLSAVVLDRVSRGPLWGVNAPGGRVEVTRTPLDGGAAVVVNVVAAPTVVTEQAGGSSSGASGSSSGASGAGGSSSGASGSSAPAGRVVAMPVAFHLRATAVASNAGAREYPAGESVELVEAAPAMTRGAAERGYRVRVVRDGAAGFAFVPTSVLGVGEAVGDVVADVGGTVARWALWGTLGAAALGAVVVAVAVGSRRGDGASAGRPMGSRPAMLPPAPQGRAVARREVPPTRSMEPPAGLVAPSDAPARRGFKPVRFPRVAA